ncbi:maleylacetate reductase [Sphingomonadales bacterium 56]|uniref:Maleylacetate reductase n=1 Tax=Sphingobium indicum TaxID=332055 RepID=A0A4Q4IUS0_9SPHN|nr:MULTISPECIES: maleylacetate reductase [Sphingobium]MBY2930691.1 maleylacetate reductase [Sphingomonadales bacterium 56]MBY2960767.1 maleylacetate reductase [Sphingomonadales bacterium 58]NYI24995.1 alcohol dehydrogenase class IV [Sphingobium indicum]RYL96729.1 maleylacetate reductase [Sphingobium indicum]CAD7341767.1 Maleylacetate reductase [Sphingobium sp. S6]
MAPFDFDILSSRVLFGPGTLDRLPAEIERLGCERALVLTTPHQRGLGVNAISLIGRAQVGLLDTATMHTPVDVSERALAVALERKADCFVAIGGGSTIGLAKALALRTDLPQIAIPTTYAGSEATPVIGETKDGRKVTQRTPKVQPETIIYDPRLSRDLPVDISVTSGVNAIAHAAEALYAQNRNPLIEALAVLGIRALVAALPKIHRNPHDEEARSDALFGAWACGVCLGTSDMALHHKLAHTLGGTFDLPHAPLHCVLLPYTLAYNSKAAPGAMAKLAEGFGSDDPIRALRTLSTTLGAPPSLAALGMPEEGIAVAAQAALQNRYPNPAELTEAGLTDLLTRAYRGDDPLP